MKTIRSKMITESLYIVMVNSLHNAEYYKDPDSNRWYSPDGKREFPSIRDAYEDYIVNFEWPRL